MALTGELMKQLGTASCIVATCSVVAELVQSMLELIFIVPMGFQPAVAREKLTWATRTNSASRSKSAGGRPGADWKNLAGNGAEGASLSRLAEPGAQQK